LPLILLSGCLGNGNYAAKNSTTDPVFTKAQNCIDSCKVYLPKLHQLSDSLKTTNQLVALKARNSYDITMDNLVQLEQLVDSLKNAPQTIPDKANYHVLIQTQIDYVNTLLSSGVTILKDGSPSTPK